MKVDKKKRQEKLIIERFHKIKIDLFLYKQLLKMIRINSLFRKLDRKKYNKISLLKENNNFLKVLKLILISISLIKINFFRSMPGKALSMAIMLRLYKLIPNLTKIHSQKYLQSPKVEYNWSKKIIKLCFIKKVMRNKIFLFHLMVDNKSLK